MILGIAGTAKNTGKTTTTNAIIEQAHQVNLRVGLTSIGYDGEDIDHVTDLPKPRVFLDKGDVVAIADGCLKGSKAEIRVLEVTPIRTPLGKVIIGEVVAKGRVVIAGPNKAKDLRVIIERLRAHGIEFILVDGALNRLAPMVVTDGLILATGASRTPEIGRLAEETGAIYKVLHLPISEMAERLRAEEGIVLGSVNLERLTFGSILLPGLVDQVMEKWQPSMSLLYVPGVIEENAMRQLVDELLARGVQGELVFHDPIKLLVGGNPLFVEEMYHKLAAGGIRMTVCTRLPLRLITINPFYPRYRVQYRNYQPDYVDAEELQSAIQRQVDVRVVNVMKEGIDLEWINRHL